MGQQRIRRIAKIYMRRIQFKWNEMEWNEMCIGTGWDRFYVCNAIEYIEYVKKPKTKISNVSLKYGVENEE